MIVKVFMTGLFFCLYELMVSRSLLRVNQQFLCPDACSSVSSVDYLGAIVFSNDFEKSRRKAAGAAGRQ